MHGFNTLLTIACNTLVGQFTAVDIEGHSLRKDNKYLHVYFQEVVG